MHLDILNMVGYEGLPTKLCQYRQGDRTAKVVLLDPDASQLARWVIFTCQSFDLFGTAPNEMGKGWQPLLGAM